MYNILLRNIYIYIVYIDPLHDYNSVSNISYDILYDVIIDGETDEKKLIRRSPWDLYRKACKCVINPLVNLSQSTVKMSAIEEWCKTYVEELWDDLDDRKDWLKDMATKENGVKTDKLIEHVCSMLNDCGLVPEGSFGDAILEVVSDMENQLSCHLDEYIINEESVMLWEEVWDTYFPEEADETESDSDSE